MKTIVLLALSMLTYAGAQAQLAGTRWKGTLDIQGPTEVVLDFGKDTLVARIAYDNSQLESMVYSYSDSTLHIRKIEGQSDCDSGILALYKLQLEKDSMTMKLESDSCYSRSAVLDGSGWKRMNE